MAVYKENIVDIDLAKGSLHRSFLSHSIGSQDSEADHFGVRVFRNGEPVDLTGVSVQGIFNPPQGSPIALTSGNIISGNVAAVVLKQACYNYDGQFCLAIKLVGGGITGTMRIVDGVVDNTHATGTVAPTGDVPTYQEIIAQYDAMTEATAAANSAIAPLYANLTFPVKKDQYTIVNGALKRALVDIASSETYTAAHWTDAKLGPEVSNLKSALNYEALHGKIIDAFINFAEGVIVRNDNNSKTIYIPCLPNTKYTITKTAGTRFVLATTATEPSFNGTNFGAILNYEYKHDAESLAITTPPNAKFLCAWVWNSSDSIQSNTMIASVMIYPQIHNENLWDGGTIIDAYIDVNNKKNVSNVNAKTIYISCEPNKKYRISKTAGTRFAVAATVNTPTADGDIVAFAFDNTADSIEFITPPNAKYLCAFVYLSTSDTSISASDMLKSCSIVCEGNGGNLWNGSTTIDAYVDWGNRNISAKNSYSITVIVPCEENKFYMVKKTAGERFAIGTTAIVPTYGTPLLNYAYGNEASELVIFAPPGAKYLCAWVYFSTQDTIPSAQMLASVFVAEYKPEILFWGDSLTAGAGGSGTTYPGVCAAELGKTHLNCGVGGETANTIAARQGGNSVIIPAGEINGQYNNGELTDLFGAAVSPLRQGDGASSGSVIFINGIACQLSLVQTSATSEDAVYTITGYTGPPSNVPILGMFVGAKYEASVVVVFVGQNGSWYKNTNNLENRIAIIDSMIAHIQHKKYVVVGLTSGTTARETEEETLTKKYGAKYIPSRALLVEQGLTIAGITPTAQDNADIENGIVPTSLRSDDVHLNASGYTALGKLVADKIRSLGYFD